MGFHTCGIYLVRLLQIFYGCTAGHGGSKDAGPTDDPRREGESG